MCGRYTLKTPPASWAQLLLPVSDIDFDFGDWQPRYNIAPTQPVIAIVRDEAGRLAAEYLRWGFIPAWATDASIGNRMINARGETVLEKRSFSGAMKGRRCLILADGYYEWQKLDAKNKQPYWIHPADQGLLPFAGLWEANRKVQDRPLRTCTIITTAAVGELASIHDRMPAVLRGPAAEQWLDPRVDAAQAQELIGACEEGFYDLRKVDRHVNNPRHEDATCLEPVE